MARRDRFFVQSVSSLFHALGEWLTPIDRGEATRHETVFFDDAWLTLGGDARVIEVEYRDARHCRRERSHARRSSGRSWPTCARSSARSSRATA